MATAGFVADQIMSDDHSIDQPIALLVLACRCFADLMGVEYRNNTVFVTLTLKSSYSVRFIIRLNGMNFTLCIFLACNTS